MNPHLLNKARLYYSRPTSLAKKLATERLPGAGRNREAFSMEITDGRRMHFRPITPNDRESMRAAFNALSLESRVFRFLSPITHLSDEVLRYFTQVDQKRHVAWCAVDPASHRPQLIGAARFVRTDDDPLVATLGLEVIDDYQHKSIGTILFCLLCNLARREGIQMLRVDLHPKNMKPLNFFGRLGISGKLQEGLIRMEFPVYQDDLLFSKSLLNRELTTLTEAIERKLTESYG